jgi:hypothetical protein
MGKRQPGVHIAGTWKNDKYSNNFHKLIKSITAVSCDHYAEVKTERTQSNKERQSEVDLSREIRDFDFDAAVEVTIYKFTRAQQRKIQPVKRVR